MKISLKISNDTLPKNGTTNSTFLCKQVLSTLASSLFSLSHGLTFAISGMMLPQLREDKTIHYDPSHESWIASIVTLSMVIGSVICGTISDSYGRKAAHIIFGIPYIVGWIVIACANSTGIILVGRFITGLSVCASRTITMVYIGEIADPKHRTVALFIPSLALYVGIILCHTYGYYLPWKISCLICLAPALTCLVTSPFLRESPLWLITKGKTDEGIQNFRWFRGTDEASETELKVVLERQSENPKTSIKESLNIVLSKAFIIPMLVLMVVMIDGQFSGMNVINFYVLDIFKLVFVGNADPFIMSIVMDCVRTAVAVIICFVAKFVSTRVAILTCTFGTVLSVFGLVTCLMVNLQTYKWISAIFFMVYITFSGAVATIGWCFVPELLPSRARGFGSGLNSAFTFLSLFVAVKITPGFVSAYGVSALFAFFGTSTLVCGIILSFVLPKTNGITLQSIEDKYSEKKMDQSAL